MEKTKIIYNPRAGEKRLAKKLGLGASLEDIKNLFQKYQFDFDICTTEYPRHAYDLTKEAINKGYKQIVVCGGDGTVNEAAQLIVGTDAVLGIVPLGTYMNIASMLSIPLNVEMAVQIIKIGQVRKIDVGVVKVINGTALNQPYYFLETSGVGLDADIQKIFREVERGKFWKYLAILQTYASFFLRSTMIDIDGKEFKVSTTLINVSNGPYTGAHLLLAPEASLIDHKLTVSLIKMSKVQLLFYFLNLYKLKKGKTNLVTTYQGESISIDSLYPRTVHADAQLFGYTPVKYQIKPSALNVIGGFPDPKDRSHVFG